MQCPKCQTENRDGRRFCAECGAPLVLPCPGCGFSNEPGEKFCGGCGMALAAGSPAGPPSPSTAGPHPAEETSPREGAPSLDAERRQLTVMFSDLVGSTALTERLDLEDMREVIRTYQETCVAVIERFEGFVARFMGDGILAYFGYPQAHEDDAERAVRSGLGIVEAMAGLNVTGGRDKGVEFAVRVGIATGLVVVSDVVGKGAAQERAVVGETPNLAARLQGLAEANTVVIAATTERLVGERFEYEDLGGHQLKGFSEPVRAWRVVRVREAESRFEAIRAGGLTPLVGRHEEIDLLLRRWTQSVEGEGQVVILSGEAGIGKSRLAQALRERVADQPHSRLRYQCSPYHQNSALHPFIAQLERAARFDPDDGPERKLDKLEALLTRSSEALDQERPLFAALLSIPTGARYPPLDMSPQLQKEKTLAVLVKQMHGLAAQLPVLFILEDAHLIDPTSMELLDLVVEAAQAAPVLVLVTCRPGFQPTWAGQAHATLLALNRMNRRQCAEMVERVTAGKGLPGEVLNQIVAKTDGVPLFVEELTKTVIDSGLLAEGTDRYTLTGPLPPLAIPSTLKDSLMARLDQLASVKEVSQIAATIGREFSYELLQAISPLPESELQEALGQLVLSELVFRRGTPPHATYAFKHALVQDTAYESLLRSKRQHLHARIANVLEERFPGTAEMEPELLAHHYTGAGLAADALGYWQRAGERAAERAAHAEAIGHLTKGLEVVKTLPDSDDRIDRELALQIALVANLRVVDRYAEALEVLDQAETAATEHGHPGDLAQIHYYRGNIYFPLGNIDGCLEQHELARKFARKASSPENEARALSGLGDAYYLRGRMKTAYDHFRRCVELCRQHGFGRIDAANLHMVGWTRVYLNELGPAVDDAASAAERAAKVGHRRAEMIARWLVGMVRTDLGDLAGAREQLEQSLDVARRLETGRFEAAALYSMAHVFRVEGRPADARAALDRALAISRQSGITFLGPSILGALALVSNDADSRGRALEEAEGVLRAGCVGHNHFWFNRDAIETCLGIGDWDSADRHAAALEDYARPEPLPWSDFFVARGRALAACGRGERGEAAFGELERLRDEANGVGLKAAVPAIEQALAAW